MTNQYNEQLKINKVRTSSSKGYQLGSNHATWKKIKQATIVSTDRSHNEQNFIEVGKLGEILIIYPVSKVLEVWYWIPNDSGVTQDFSGDTLYFYNQYDLLGNTDIESQYPASPAQKPFNSGTNDSIKSYYPPHLANKVSPVPVVTPVPSTPDSDTSTKSDNSVTSETIKSLNIIEGDLYTGYKILLSYNSELQILTIGGNSKSKFLQTLQLPPYFDSESLTIKLNTKFIVVGNDKGFIYIYKYDSELDKYIPGNCNEGLKNLKKSTSLPIIRSFELIPQVSDDEILFKTSCFHGKAIFDLNNNWLVYSPTKIEYDQIKIDNENKDSLTPVKLPNNSKPLLNKVLESISNSALDSLFKFSKFSTTKINDYLKNKDNEEKDEINLKSLTKTLNKILNNTITQINESFSTDNQLIKIVDLTNDKVLTVFKSPDGVSNLSLSPYDLQLINCNLRGDNFFIWDLLKLPNQVLLLGKFLRGKTSGIIEDIFWFINKESQENDLIKGINSGFGTMNAKTGTIHWFNINYLLGNLNNNLPNYLGKEFPISANQTDKVFLDSWILSSNTKYKRFFKLPNLLNLNSHNFRTLNQLAVLDENNNLKLISPLNGSNRFRFELPANQTNPELVTSNDCHKLCTEEKHTETSSISKIEIETCKPFKNLINFKNLQFSVYDFPEDDCGTFVNYYSSYNNDLPTKKIVIDSEEEETAKENDFVESLVDDLLIET